jgi:hypothetical protein
VARPRRREPGAQSHLTPAQASSAHPAARAFVDLVLGGTVCQIAWKIQRVIAPRVQSAFAPKVQKAF